jgi:hypothetical protein
LGWLGPLADFCELDFLRGRDGRALVFPALAKTGSLCRPPLEVLPKPGLDDDSEVVWEVEPDVLSDLCPLDSPAG